MAQHGYLRGYDEDPRSSDDRDRGDWRDRDDQNWRSRERGRGFMFDDDRDRSRDRDEDRGFFSRMGEGARSWFGDDERGGSDRGAWENNRDWPQRNRGSSDYGREHGYGGFQGDDRGGRRQGGFGGSNEWREGRRSFSSHADDHYRSWRDKQMQSLDQDYADYCREREQQFHSDFDSWRKQRHGNHQPLRTGMTQSGLSDDPSGELQLSTENQSPSEPQQDPMATLGTTSSGRKRSEG